jgi:hypothetical protein
LRTACTTVVGWKKTQENSIMPKIITTNTGSTSANSTALEPPPTLKW